MAQQMNPGGAGVSPSVNPNILNEIRTFVTRIRSLEERVNNLRKSFQVTEQNIIEVNKKLNEETSTQNSEILDMKRDISQMKNKMELVIKELMLTAKKEDVDVINKYLNLWKPIDFVTRSEIKKIVRSYLYELSIRSNFREDIGTEFAKDNRKEKDEKIKQVNIQTNNMSSSKDYQTQAYSPETQSKPAVPEMAHVMSRVSNTSQKPVQDNSSSEKDDGKFEITREELEAIKENIIKEINTKKKALSKTKPKSKTKKKLTTKKSSKKSTKKKSKKSK